MFPQDAMEAMHMEVPMEQMYMDPSMMSGAPMTGRYMVCTVPEAMPMGSMMSAGAELEEPDISQCASWDVPSTCQKKQLTTEELRKAFLLPLSSEEGKLAARVLAKRVQQARRVKANHCMFSALHLDVVPRARFAARSKQPEVLQTSRQATLSQGKAQSSTKTDLTFNSSDRYSDGQAKTTIPDCDEKESNSCGRCSSLDEWEEMLPPQRQLSAGTDPSLELKAASFAAARSGLLDFRGFVVGPKPPELQQLSVKPTRTLLSLATQLPPPGDLVAKSGGHSSIEPIVTASPSNTPSRSSARLRDAAGDLRRSVQSLLNKVCPENVGTIADRIAAIEVADIDQLEIIIELIFKKALAEPHYCETYADLVFSLKSVFPEFPSPDSAKPATFRSLVLNICQSEFEELLAAVRPASEDGPVRSGEELELAKERVVGRMRANMKFIGHLFLRQLLSAKVICSVLCELVLCDFEDYIPEEHTIECACELLLAVGHTLEALPAGVQAVQQICSRLLDLKSRRTMEGKAAYSKRVQFVVQNVLDARSAGWATKTFRSSAKTKEEIRLEQQREMDARSRGAAMPAGAGELIVAGQQPQYMGSSSS